MRVAGLILPLALAGSASSDSVERIDSIGAVTAITKDGRPSAGFKLGVNLVDRFVLGARTNHAGDAGSRRQSRDLGRRYPREVAPHGA